MIGPDVLLALLRLWVGVAAGAHGLSHLCNLERFKSTMIREGLHPARFWAVVSSSLQVAGAVLVVLGLAVPLGCAAVAAGMWMAFLMHRHHGFWVHRNGYEYPLFLFVFSGALAAAGPGRFSLDAALGLQAFFARPVVALAPFAAAWLGATLTWASRDRSAASSAASVQH